MLKSLFALLVLGAATAGAASETIDAQYRVSLIGLPLGTATVSGTVAPGGYKVEANTKLTGLASVVSSARGAATSTGVLAGARVLPSGYATTSANSDGSRTVRMSISNGAATAVDISPPFEANGPRVPLTEAAKQGIIDPMSALIMAVPDGQPLVGPTACNRRLPIFDGYTRFDVNLAYTGTRQMHLKGYSGPVSVCQARYVPIAGYRTDKPQAKYMADNKQMEVWLAPLPQAHVVVPLRISVMTMVGTIVIEATEISGLASVQPTAVAQ